MYYTAYDLEQAWGLSGVVLENGKVAQATGQDDSALAKINERLDRAKAAQTLAVPKFPAAERYQVLEWLILNGISKNVVAQHLNQIADPVQRDLAISRWESVTRIPREHPLTLLIANALGLSEADMDEAWETLLQF